MPAYGFTSDDLRKLNDGRHAYDAARHAITDGSIAPEDRPFFPCTFCGVNAVDAEAGEDTCWECLRKM